MLKQIILSILLLIVFTVNVLAEEGAAEKVTVEKSGNIELLADASAEIKAALDSDGFMLPGNIGELIDDARLSGDPADSWPVVMAIGAAEMMSASTSELVSAELLFNEAVEKARRNQDSLSLMMAAHILKSMDMAEESDALWEESQAAASSDDGEKAGPYTFDLEVNNYWGEAADIYLDDWYLGTVGAGYYMYFNDIPIGWYYLYAYGVYTGDYGIISVEGDPYSFTSVDLY